ncbi:MAG: HipA domain-containing protein [Alphaproteobacteria bacterium]|nr:HipA domain-containing protein [Alphaproteobacteria bacterium]
MKSTQMLTQDRRETEKMFRLMCFSTFMQNRDDYVKNFFFIYANGWRNVSPTYDLFF